MSKFEILTMDDTTTNNMTTDNISETGSDTKYRGKQKPLENISSIYYHAIVLHVDDIPIKALILSSHTKAEYDIKRNNITRYDKMFHPGEYLTKNGTQIEKDAKTLNDIITHESCKGIPQSRKTLITDIYNHGKNAFKCRLLTDCTFIQEFGPDIIDQKKKRSLLSRSSKDHLMYACSKFKQMNPTIEPYNDMDIETCRIDVTQQKPSGIDPHVKVDNSASLSGIIDKLTIESNGFKEDVKTLRTQLENSQNELKSLQQSLDKTFQIIIKHYKHSTINHVMLINRYKHDWTNILMTINYYKHNWMKHKKLINHCKQELQL